MQIQILKSKIHRVTVTEADLNYIGSITIDEEGNVINPQINRGHGLTYRANARALNLVKTLKWEPAMKDGKPVRSEIMVVVRFPKTEETPWF